MTIQDVLLQHGIWGVVVFALGISTYRLYLRVQELHDKRLEDMKTLSAQYREALMENTKTVEAWSRALERGRP
jgi:hypothetical protein